MEKALFIMPTLNVTQGYDTGTHRGSFALDLAGEDTGIDWCYAPFTGVVRMSLSESYGNWLWIESVEPVLCANEEIAYLTMMLGHDNKVRHKVGDIIKQGEKFFAEGTSGQATGNHVHLELGKGRFMRGGWYANNYGVFMIYNAVKPNEYLAIPDGWRIVNSGGYPWKWASQVHNPTPGGNEVMNYIPKDFNYERGKFTANRDLLRIRKAPSVNGVDTGLVYNSGMSVNYDGFVRREGYVWISWISAQNGERRWMAVGKTNAQGVNVDPWGTFS